tara:strand:+ start:1031 stop:3256 length:2226 start_codon:yes stop_codon:yes gene_type:complete
MPLVNFANLDFDQIKVTIKDYLRSNSNFTDYDFEGSNLSTIIDVLAYNTYITSYNANMVSNEVFLDSATLRENVVSLIQNIGYLPRSRRAARLNASFYVDTSGYATQPQIIKLKKGIVASTTQFTNESFTFASLDDITKPVYNNRAVFSDVELLEGQYLTTNFTVDAYNPNQRFILPNIGIDTSTIRVVVKPSRNSATSRNYAQTGSVTSTNRHVQSLFEIDSTSAVYWIQEIEGEKYELIFGDGIFGVKLEAPNYIEVSYIVTKGQDGNGISSLTFNGRLVTGRSNIALTSGISLINISRPSSNGADIESIESIKNYAPRVNESQNRAVTAADYESLIPTIFPETEVVRCFGGEELSPPRYGRVYCAIKPDNGSYLSNSLKENLKDTVEKYNVGGIGLTITDLSYLYIELDINAYYDCSQSGSGGTGTGTGTGGTGTGTGGGGGGLSPQDIINDIIDAINEYINGNDVGRLNGRFQFSKFLCLIDGANPAITSNITGVRIRRDLRVTLNSLTEYEICFGNRMLVLNCEGHNIRTTAFTVSGIQGEVYLSDIPNPDDHTTGTLFLFRLMSPTQMDIVRSNVGTIDYEHGEIKLTPLLIIDTDVHNEFPVIQIDAIPASPDVMGHQDLYTKIGGPYFGDGDTGEGGAGGGDLNNGIGDGISVDVHCDTEEPVTTYGEDGIVRGEPHFGCNTDGNVSATNEEGMTETATSNNDGSYTITNYSRGMANSATTYYPDGSVVRRSY